MALDKNAITKEAQKYASKGQFDKAIAEWRKLLKETPGDSNIYNTIGDLCLKKDAKAEAVDAYMRAADMLADDGFSSKAIALYKKIVNIDPKKIEVHLTLGDLNAEKGLTGNALESYKIVADHYQKSNQTAKVLGIYQKMADLNPANVAFRTKLADMYLKEGMKKEAVQAYLAAATAHIGGNKFNEARQLFEKVLAVDPDNKEVYHKAGIVYFKEGKFAEACKAFKPAFESDPSNQELAELYLEALTAAGRKDDAAEFYQRILEHDPSRTDLREKLFHHYREKKEPEKALAEARKLADEQVRILLAAAAETGKKLLPGSMLPGADQETEAEKAFKLFIEENPDNIEARRALCGYYDRIGRKQDAANAITQAARVLIAAGKTDAARDTLNRALELWPGLAEAQQMLDQLAVAAAAPAAPEAPPAAPAAPAEDPAIGEGLTEAEVLVKYGLTAKALEQLEVLAAKFPDVLRIRVRMRDLYRDSGDAKKSAAHALKAADICSGEGRADQAESLLREALETDPRNAEILSRLGMAPPAPEEAPPAAEGFGELPPFEVPETPIVLPVPPPAPPEEELAPPLPEPVIPMPEPPPAPQEEAVEQKAPPAPRKARGKPKRSEPEPVAEETRAVEAPAPGEEPSRELAGEPIAAEADISEVWAEAEFYYQQGLYDEARKKYEQVLALRPDDQRVLKRMKEISRQKDEVQAFSNLAEAVEGLESLVPGGELAAGELATSTSDEEAVRSLMQDIKSMKQEEAAREQEKERQRLEREQREREVRELAEKDAQLRAEQEARERAERELQELRRQREREREARELAEKDAQLRAEQEARERAERELQELRRQREREREARAQGEKDAQQRAGQEARERAEKELMALAEEATLAESEAGWSRPEEDFSELGDELRSKPELFTEPPPSPKAAPGKITAPHEDFFDLAAELKEELGSIAAPERAAGQTEEQSLDDIFEDFKRGVAEQESKQDVNTHYNLGIAYKEMGLLDDAIAEFMLTTEGEQRFVESKYMLGLCYLEQGEYYKAIAEIHNALNYAVSFGVSDEDRISMFYDLGLAYQGVGNTEEAISQFQMVVQLSPEYRDAAVKLHELRAGDLVSLEQLKDDIEKEISTKFLEEGERIEREEKTRKDDRVRQ